MKARNKVRIRSACKTEHRHISPSPSCGESEAGEMETAGRKMVRSRRRDLDLETPATEWDSVLDLDAVVVFLLPVTGNW
jgi:hypothetical protein